MVKLRSFTENEIAAAVSRADAATELQMSRSGVAYLISTGSLEAIPTAYGRLVVRKSLDAEKKRRGVTTRDGSGSERRSPLSRRMRKQSF